METYVVVAVDGPTFDHLPQNLTATLGIQIVEPVAYSRRPCHDSVGCLSPFFIRNPLGTETTKPRLRALQAFGDVFPLMLQLGFVDEAGNVDAE